ncbi:MAG: Y-family DNA polymerase [Candidatus Wallbacteria bacterium]|nr:Y-family DNA polymerase [Candidatus Wallbacteria bacterium]
MNSLFALVDCNNFYVSCERVFNPRLLGKPVVILSNNDGCIVSRSNEAKRAGISMGVPVYQCHELIRRMGVRVLSSNYALYGDMSDRVMETLRTLAPEVEVYSIDEAFLPLDGMKLKDLAAFGERIRRIVRQWTGIPVTVGVASTRTLAKIACARAKNTSGVLVVEDGSMTAEILAATPVEEVWGIGDRSGLKLRKAGMETALDLRNGQDNLIRKVLHVTGLRTAYELRGKSSIESIRIADKKAIMCSRSFGRPVEEKNELREGLAYHATRACEKLRRQGAAAGLVTVFIDTGRFRGKVYSASTTVTLTEPDFDTAVIIRAAGEGLERIFRSGFLYLKSGVLLSGIVGLDQVQQNLFTPGRGAEKKRNLYKAVDLINSRFGRDSLRPAATGLSRKWAMKRKMCSPRYTTVWGEIPLIRDRGRIKNRQTGKMIGDSSGFR